jgi:hypothetical protein
MARRPVGRPRKSEIYIPTTFRLKPEIHRMLTHAAKTHRMSLISMCEACFMFCLDGNELFIPEVEYGRDKITKNTKA